MRMLISVLILAMVALPASAKSKTKTTAKKSKAAAHAPSKFTGKLLSYNALMKLPKKKRMQYMRDVIDLLATMESFNTKYTVAELDMMREFKAQVAQLMKTLAVLPQAHAEDDDDFTDTPPPLDVSKIRPAYNGVEWTCGRGAVFDYVMRACMVLNIAGQTSFSPRSSRDEYPIYCPNGTKEVPHYRSGVAACIPNANWEVIPAERKSSITDKPFQSPSFLREKSFEEQQALILGGGAPKGKPGDSVFGPVPVIPQSQGRPSAAAPQADNDNDDDAPAVAQPGAPAQAGVPLAVIPPGSVPTQAGVPAVVPPGTAAPAQPGVPAVTPPADDAPPADATPGAVGTGQSPPPAKADDKPDKPDTCEPAAQACKKLTEAERTTAIGRWRSPEAYQGADANVCISGGFASKYKGKTKDAGTCDILRSLPGVPLPVVKGKKTEMCPPNEALCNPALFCIGGKNPKGNFEPVTFCVEYGTAGNDKKNRPITDLCAAAYAKKLDPKNPKPLIDCKVDPKLKGEAKAAAELDCKNKKAIKAEVCDPAWLPAEANFKKIWEDLIAGTQKLRDVWCGNSDFAALFCRECEVINYKAYAMNKNATGSGCPEVTAPAQAGVPAVPAQPAPPASDPDAVREGAPRTDGR